MKQIFGKTVWAAFTIFAAAAALAMGQPAQESEKGEKIVNGSCTSCHDIRKIQTQALDQAGWSKIVQSMMDKGAKVEKDDVPTLVQYLTEKQGPLPDGPGKEIVLNKCTVCHELSRVRRHLGTPEDWADTLSAMFNEGLVLSDEEFATVLRYLARNFRQ